MDESSYHLYQNKSILLAYMQKQTPSASEGVCCPWEARSIDQAVVRGEDRAQRCARSPRMEASKELRERVLPFHGGAPYLVLARRLDEYVLAARVAHSSGVCITVRSRALLATGVLNTFLSRCLRAAGQGNFLDRICMQAVPPRGCGRARTLTTLLELVSPDHGGPPFRRGFGLAPSWDNPWSAPASG